MGYKWGWQCCGCDFRDEFSEAPTGYTTYEIASSSVAPVFELEAGDTGFLILDNVNSDGTFYRAVDVGDWTLPGWFLRVSTKVRDISGGANRIGVFVGEFTSLHSLPSASAGRQDVDELGEPVGSSSTYGSGGNDDDELAVEIYRENGTWTVQFILNGTLLETIEDFTPDAAPVVGTEWNIGLYSLDGGKWDWFEIECSGTPTKDVSVDPEGCDETACITVGESCVDTCDECTDMPGGFVVDFGALMSSPQSEHCCPEAGGWHFLTYLGGCVFETSRFECGGDSGAYWSLTVKATDSTLTLVTNGTVDGDGLGPVVYERASALECLCRNEFVLGHVELTCGIGPPEKICLIPQVENGGGCTDCCVIPPAYSVTFSSVRPSDAGGGFGAVNPKCEIADCEGWNKTHVVRLLTDAENAALTGSPLAQSSILYSLDDGTAWPPTTWTNAQSTRVAADCCLDTLFFRCTSDDGHDWILNIANAEGYGTHDSVSPVPGMDVFSDSCLGSQTLLLTRPPTVGQLPQALQTTCDDGNGGGSCVWFEHEITIKPIL